MKKVVVLSVVAAAALAFAGVSFAHMGDGGTGPGYGMGPGMMYGAGTGGTGPGYGMGPGMMYGAGTGGTVNIEKLKQFRKETATLRDDLAVKQAELNAEFGKEKPDTDRVTTLQKDILDLRARIAKAADKTGLEETGAGWGRHHGYGMGPGMMYGSGYGYGCSW